MIDINKCKLVPGVSTYWGFIAGNIEDQKDLVEYISTHGGGKAEWGSISGNIQDQSDLISKFSSYATKSWVSSQGFLTSETLPSDIATQSWVVSQGYLTSVPSGYATESWVQSQGYLTSIPSEYATEQFVTDSLSGYATESWVQSQGYLTTVPSGYATEQFVTDSLSGYATESWVSSQGYLTSVPSEYATQSWVSSQGYITSSALSSYATQSYVSENAVLYDFESPFSDFNFDVLKREYDEDLSMTNPLILGYSDNGEGTWYQTVAIKNGIVGLQYFNDSGEGLEETDFFEFYAMDPYLYPVEYNYNEDDDSSWYALKHAMGDADDWIDLQNGVFIGGAFGDDSSFDGLMIKATGEVGKYHADVIDDGSLITLDETFQEFATKDYVDGLVGTALDMTNNILDQEEEEL